LDRREDARAAFERALELNPDLDEAHFALGLWHLREPADLVRALDHLERISSLPGSALSLRPVIGWKARVLFRLARFDEAFAAVDAALAADRLFTWEWPWCARLVREHGKRTTAAAARALKFWRKFLRAHPNDRWALDEEFNCAWGVHQKGEPTGLDLATFAEKGEALLGLASTDRALLWDRIGHWAQTDGDWTSAEAAYRKAYEVNAPRYSYCLATALNHLVRWKDALDILLPIIEAEPSDAMSWFQVARAREKLGDVRRAVEGYRRAIEIDPAYSLAHFNLGGVLWNSGDEEPAVAIWREAIGKFPEHALTAKLLKDLPVLSQVATSE
jgi:tetratricopeptide (TPR) repeat protein